MCISGRDFFPPQREHKRENETDFNITKLIVQFFCGLLSAYTGEHEMCLSKFTKRYILIFGKKE